jgi:hypothetical protein
MLETFEGRFVEIGLYNYKNTSTRGGEQNLQPTCFRYSYIIIHAIVTQLSQLRILVPQVIQPLDPVAHSVSHHLSAHWAVLLESQVVLGQYYSSKQVFPLSEAPPRLVSHQQYYFLRQVSLLPVVLLRLVVLQQCPWLDAHQQYYSSRPVFPFSVVLPKLVVLQRYFSLKHLSFEAKLG